MAQLEVYFQSTAIVFTEWFNVQKKGICICALVAPILCDIFLSAMDRHISGPLDLFNVVKIFCYGDPFWLIWGNVQRIL